MENKKVQESISMIYADAKTTTTLAVRNVMKAFPLPVFMFENILESILLEVRGEKDMELSTELQKYKEEILKQHEDEIKELEEKFNAEKEELIRQFENPEEIGAEKTYVEEEPEPEGVEEQEV